MYHTSTRLDSGLLLSTRAQNSPSALPTAVKDHSRARVPRTRRPSPPTQRLCSATSHLDEASRSEFVVRLPQNHRLLIPLQRHRDLTRLPDRHARHRLTHRRRCLLLAVLVEVDLRLLGRRIAKRAADLSRTDTCQEPHEEADPSDPMLASYHMHVC